MGADDAPFVGRQAAPAQKRGGKSKADWSDDRPRTDSMEDTLMTRREAGQGQLRPRQGGSLAALAAAAAMLLLVPVAVVPAPVANGLVLWLDAGQGVTADGDGRVSAWSDLSGQGHHAAMPELSRQPLRVPGQLNGLPVVRFDGSDDLLSVSGQVLTSQQFSLFAVVNDTIGPGTPGGFREVLSNWTYCCNGTMSVFFGTVGSSPVRIRLTDDFGGASDPVNNRGVSEIADPWKHFIFTGIAGAYDAYVYQGSTLRASKGSPISERNLSVPYVIGSQGEHPEYWSGDIVEILVYDRELSGVERQQNWDYLQAKYFAPPALSSLELSKSAVSGCKTVTGTVTLPSAAPPEGVVVLLSDSLASASTPATLKILAGATSKTFTVKTLPVETEETGTVSATLGSTTLSQPLTVRPMGLTSVTLTPTTVVGSQPVTGKATLECNAGPGPITVDLSSNNPGIAYPISTNVVVPQGLKSGYFDVTTNAVLTKSYATIAGTANGITKSKKLTVSVAAAVSPTSLKFGSVTVGTTSAPLTTTLTNKGAAPLSVNSITLTGTAASWFAQTKDCPASLAPGATCTVSVTFKPISAASKSAKLSIATSATATPLSVSLSGTGVLP